MAGTGYQIGYEKYCSIRTKKTERNPGVDRHPAAGCVLHLLPHLQEEVRHS